MSNFGRDLILAGVLCLMITYSPDKSIGYGIGIGVILLGLCVWLSKNTDGVSNGN